MDGEARASIGSRELKTHLGKYLDLVRRGTTITVTDRGRPVAELRPLGTISSDNDSVLAEMAAHGLLTTATRHRPLAARRPLLVVSGAGLSSTVVDLREDRF